MSLAVDTQHNNQIEKIYNYELSVIDEIKAELAMNALPHNNKDIINVLLSLLETEQDVIKLDVYRNCLEIILTTTPDDI